MQVKLAEKEDFKNIRYLWKHIFNEDSDSYLDFYFEYVMLSNKVFIIYDEIGNVEIDSNSIEVSNLNNEKQIIGMLHMNPYQIVHNDSIEKIYYIVGVATHPEHRRKGIMKLLMTTAIEFAKDEGVHSLILLPEDERYYKPFGFEFTSYQYNTRIKTDGYSDLVKYADDLKEKANDGIHAQDESYNINNIEIFKEWFAKNKNTYKDIEAFRSPFYLEKFYHEILCEDGKIAVLNGNLVIYYIEEFFEVRKYFLKDLIYEQQIESNMIYLAAGLIRLANGLNIILHEVNERELSSIFTYSRRNNYDYRPYMMALPLKKECKKIYFDEIV